MKNKKIILTVIIVLSILLSSTTSCFGHELISGMKWRNTTTSSGVDYLYLYVDKTYLNSVWQTACSSAVSNWKNYTDYVKGSATNTANAGVDCASTDEWFSFVSSNAAAITNICDNEGNWAWSFSDGSGNDITGYMTYAQIYTNSDWDSQLSTTQRAWVMGHELGHVLALGHPSSSTKSIMHTGTTPTWSNYQRPQTHDNSDLSNYYSDILGR